MTGTLALVGGDPFSDACTFNRDLAEAVGAREAVIVPTAAAFEHAERWIEQATGHFGAFDVSVEAPPVLTRADAMTQSHAAVVRDAALIYLVGPSALHARPTLQDTPVWDALVEAWNEGATVIGSDGGAQILGDPMVDDRGGAFTVGLGLIERLAVVTRHDHWSDEALHRLHQMTNPDVVVLGLDEATAAIRAPEGTWTAAGAGEVHVRLGAEPVELSSLIR